MSAVRRWLPPQHGAWAMLLVPYLVGLAIGGARPVHAPLLVAWVAGYLASYYALQAVKTRRPARVRTQVATYGSVAVVAGALVVFVDPGVLVFAPAYAGLLAVNAWYAWRRRERALLNDVASVAQSCLMVPVAAGLAGVAGSVVPVASAVVFAYFAGTVLYVKTMIRERGAVAYRRASVAYHVAALVAVGWLSVPAAVLFAALLVRAWWLPSMRLSPKRVGLIEVGFSALLFTVAAWTL